MRHTYSAILAAALVLTSCKGTEEKKAQAVAVSPAISSLKETSPPVEQDAGDKLQKEEEHEVFSMDSSQKDAADCGMQAFKKTGISVYRIGHFKDDNDALWIFGRLTSKDGGPSTRYVDVDLSKDGVELSVSAQRSPFLSPLTPHDTLRVDAEPTGKISRFFTYGDTPLLSTDYENFGRPLASALGKCAKVYRSPGS